MIMTFKTAFAWLGIACSYQAIAADGGTASGTAAASVAEVRTLSERVPAGGTVQIKYLLTQPRPITSGGYGFASYGFAVDGISINSPLGDSAGAGVATNGMLNLSVISPNSDFGSNLDYPFITMTMDVPASTPAGSAFPLGIANASFVTPAGPLTLADPKPGTLIIGGTISVRGVFPGGGTYPGGTVISVRGTGFQRGTKITTKMKTSAASYLSPNEMRFTLQEPATMDNQPIQVSNPDGSQVVFYSYLRGVAVNVPSGSVLKSTEPVFQALTHGSATITGAACADSQELALAIQNPNSWTVSIALTNQTTGSFVSILLPQGARVMDKVGALLAGPAPASTDQIVIAATSGAQMLGLCADENAFTVTPVLPAF